MVKGDLNAIMACCQLGKRRFEEILQRFGREVVERASEVVLEQTAATLRRVMAEKIPDGTFSFTDYLDSDGVSDNSYSVALTLKKSTDQISMDFAKSGDQAIGAINFKMDKSVPANMMGLLLTGDEPGVEMNSGFSRAIDEVILRPGSIVDPLYPAPVGMRAHTMVRVTSTLLGVIGQATEGQMSAASPVYVLYYLRSHDRLRGSYELCIEGLGVGFGARTFSDGIDAVYFVAQKNYPVEFAEMEFGVRIEGYRIHEDSGGPGYYRGGAGIVRDVRVIGDEAVLGIRLDNVRFPAWGTNGGQAGGSGNVVINPGTKEERTLVPMSDQNRLEKGDLLRVMTSGGGGWGDPFTRPPETVLDDVLDGFVSIEKAHLDYGVIVTEDRDVDIAATEKLRQQRSTATAFVNRGSTEVPNVSNS
jgi:N-methylhydantoinase B